MDYMILHFYLIFNSEKIYKSPEFELLNNLETNYLLKCFSHNHFILSLFNILTPLLRISKNQLKSRRWVFSWQTSTVSFLAT